MKQRASWETLEPRLCELYHANWPIRKIAEELDSYPCEVRKRIKMLGLPARDTTAVKKTNRKLNGHCEYKTVEEEKRELVSIEEYERVLCEGFKRQTVEQIAEIVGLPVEKVQLYLDKASNCRVPILFRHELEDGSIVYSDKHPKMKNPPLFRTSYGKTFRNQIASRFRHISINRKPHAR